MDCRPGRLRSTCAGKKVARWSPRTSLARSTSVACPTGTGRITLPGHGMSPLRSTPAPAARPWAQRGYATLVVALAAFLAAMVMLRVPFRGYLVEGRVSGCLDASLTEADLRQFLK